MKQKSRLIVAVNENVKVNHTECLITVKEGKKVYVSVNTEGLTNEQIENIQWIYSTFYDVPEGLGFHDTLKGPKIGFHLSDESTGGGYVWLEPVLPGQKPTYKTPNGYYVRSEGPFEVKNVVWREIDRERNYPVVTSKKFFRERVQLHIYTRGLYGHDIKIYLVDKDMFFDDDLLVKDPKQGEKAYSYLQREVKNLKDINGERAQKVVLDLFIEPRWEKDGGSYLKIYPKIVAQKKNKSKVFTFNNESSIIEITKRDTYDRPLQLAKKQGNKPVEVGRIVTDIAEIKPCFFTEIKANVTKGGKKMQEDVIIYKQGITPADKYVFPVVAGVQFSKSQIKFTLNTNLEKCAHENNKEKHHKGKVIDISKIKEAVIVESRKPENKDAKLTKGNLDVKQDYGVFNITEKNEVPEVREITTYKNVVSSDQELEIDLAYDFSNKGRRESVVGMLKNIWPTNPSNAIKYPIKFNTCRKEIAVDVAVYPDIKWILQLGFNYDAEKLEQMRTEEHKKYELKVKELEQAYKLETGNPRDRKKDLEEYKKRAETRKERIQNKIKKETNLKRTQELIKAEVKAQRDIEKWEHKITAQKRKINAKKREYKEYKKEAKQDKKQAIKQRTKRRNAYAEKILGFELSLAADFDSPYKGMELTHRFDRAKEFLNYVVTLNKYAQKFAKGEEKTKGQPEKEDGSKLAELAEKLKGRPLFSFEVIPTALALLLSWRAEHPKTGKGANTPAIGVLWEGEIKAEPLVGLKFNFDIIALAAKSHPILRGLVTIMDFASSFVDEAEIKIDFSLEGKISLAGKGSVNTYSGRTNYNQEELAASDNSPFKVTGALNAEVVAHIKLVERFETCLFADVEAGIDVGAKALSGVEATGSVKADDKGMYLEPEIKFKGIKVILHINILFEAKEDENKSNKDIKNAKSQKTVFSSKTEKKVELVLMKEYTWGKDELGSTKWYIT